MPISSCHLLELQPHRSTRAQVRTHTHTQTRFFLWLLFPQLLTVIRCSYIEIYRCTYIHILNFSHHLGNSKDLAPLILLCFSESSPKPSFLCSCYHFITHCFFSSATKKLELGVVQRTPTVIEYWTQNACVPCTPGSACLGPSPGMRNLAESPCLHCKFQITV